MSRTQDVRQIVSVGAEVDPAGLEREVMAEVARKRGAGVYSDDLLLQIAVHPVGDMIMALRDASQFSVQAAPTATRPPLGFVFSRVQGFMARALRWHTRWLVGQVQTFATATVASITLVQRRLEDHERRLGRAGLAPVGTRGEGSDQTWRFAPHVAALRQARGRVVDLGCRQGVLLDLLRSAGVDAYGVEPEAELAEACCRLGLEVRPAGLLEHLAAVPPGSLFGVAATEVNDRLPATDIAELFRLARMALVENGVFVADVRICPGMEAVDLVALASRAGFRDTRAVELAAWPADLRLLSLPPAGDPRLNELVVAVNANLERIDVALFGPRFRALVANR